MVCANLLLFVAISYRLFVHAIEKRNSVTSLTKLFHSLILFFITHMQACLILEVPNKVIVLNVTNNSCKTNFKTHYANQENQQTIWMLMRIMTPLQEKLVG